MRGEASLSADRQSRDLLAPKLRDCGVETWRIGEELFVMTQLLDENAKVEQSLTDPSRPTSDKVTLLNNILGGEVHPYTLEVLQDLVGRRWSRVSDIANAVEDFAVDAMMYYSDATKCTLAVSIELAKIESSLLNSPVLCSKLADSSISAQARENLLDKVFDSSDLNKVTMCLVRHLVCSPRHRTLLTSLRWLIAKFSRHMGASMVTVTAATQLSHDQIRRLMEHFSAQLGHPAHINLMVDPSVIGGMRIQIGDDVTDHTVAAQLAWLERSIKTSM